MIAKRDSKAPNMMRAADEIIDKDSIDTPRPPRKEYSAPVAPVVPEISPEEAKEKEAEKEKEKVTIESLKNSTRSSKATFCKYFNQLARLITNANYV